MKKWLAILTLTVAAWGQAPPFPTTLNLFQPHSPPPFQGLNGKNKVATDPDYGSLEIQCTDGTSGIGDNADMQTTDASSSYPVWNSDSTLLVLHNTGAQYFVFQFDPVAHTCTQLANPGGGTPITGLAVWSKINPGLLYNEQVGSIGKINELTYAKTGGIWAWSSTATDVIDFTTNPIGQPCIPSGTVITKKWSGDLSISENIAGVDTLGQAYSLTNSDQDHGTVMCLFKAGSGYRALNTNFSNPSMGTTCPSATMCTWGDYGSVGVLTGVAGAALSPATLLLHNADQLPNPNYTNLAPTYTDDQYIWRNDSTTMVLDGLTGHHAQGYYSEYSLGAGGGQAQFVAPSACMSGSPPTFQTGAMLGATTCQYGFQFADPPGWTPIWTSVIPTTTSACPPCNGPALPAKLTPTPQTYTGDQHSALGIINSSSPINGIDRSIMWVSNGPQNPGPPPQSLYPLTSTWQNQIRGYDLAGTFGTKGLVYRVNFTQNSGMSQTFDVLNAFSTASRDGHWVAFNSDMIGANCAFGSTCSFGLGSNSGASTCTVGTDCQGQVFIVQVLPPSTTTISSQAVIFASLRKAIDETPSPFPAHRGITYNWR